MYRIVLGMAAVATMAAGAESASAQVPAIQTFPQTAAPQYQPVTPVVGGTIVSPGVAVTGYIAPPTVVVPAVTPVIGIGWPYSYYRPYPYYPHHYHRHW
jgi:hypothetical protein